MIVNDDIVTMKMMISIKRINDLVKWMLSIDVRMMKKVNVDLWTAIESLLLLPTITLDSLRLLLIMHHLGLQHSLTFVVFSCAPYLSLFGRKTSIACDLTHNTARGCMLYPTIHIRTRA